MKPTVVPKIYGLMAEFDTPSELIEAARHVRDAGFRRVEGYTPYPVEELGEVLHFGRSWLPPLVFLGGLFGGMGGYFLQYWVHVIHYPLNSGGKPLHSWPMFIPITFETTILGAALTAVFGMLALNGLPMPYHPVFNVPRFSLASRDGFFLMIRTIDPLFDAARTRQMLVDLKARAIFEVPP